MTSQATPMAPTISRPAACLLAALPLAMALAAPGAAQAVPIALVNAGFEASWANQAAVGSDGHVVFYYQTSGPAMGWQFGSGTGVAASYGLLSAYEGSRFALLQIHTGPLSQTFDVAAESTVDLGFAMALRPGYWAGQVVRVSVDGQMVADLGATSTSWQMQHVSLGTLAAGQHTLAFAGLAHYDGFRDTTAYLDAVSLEATAAVPEPQGWALLAAGLLAIGTLRRRSRQRD